MKFYCISDNHDTLVGLRLAGIEGVAAQTRDQVEAALQACVNDPQVGLVLITEKLTGVAGDLVDDMKLHCSRPLVLEIPDRHGSGRSADSVTRYIREAIGLKM